MTAEPHIRCSRTSARLIASLILWIPAAASLSPAQDGIELTVEKGPGAEEVTLLWTGGVSPWEVFSSADPAAVGAPLSRLGETTGDSWNDSPPIARVIFYRVNACGVPPNPVPHGCVSCSCCDLWSISWNPVQCATYYLVSWQCGFFQQTWNLGNVTFVNDLCDGIDMCSGCANGIGYVRVQACNASGCSTPVNIPIGELPAACGGGCCC